MKESLHIFRTVTLLTSLGALAYLCSEPSIIMGATTATSQFTISQTLSNELAIITPPSNVTMSPALGGITGGTANGSTLIVVRSAGALGYQMTIQASSSLGMIGSASSSNRISAYVPSTANVPDLNFTAPANAARFGYTVEASSTADLSQTFRDNGSVCNSAGGSDTVDKCWLNSSTTPVTIINSTGPTPIGGATTTIKFRVIINSNPSPMIPDDTYVSTTTITATSN